MMKRSRVQLTAMLACLAPVGVAAQGDSITPALATATFDSVWQTIRRVHHDTTKVGVSWERLRDTLRPRAVTLTSRRDLHAILGGMLAVIGESHHAILPGDADVDRSAEGVPGGALGTPGLTLRVLANEVIVTDVAAQSAAAAAGIRVGWRLDSINGLATAPVVARAARAGLVAPFLVVSALTQRLEGPTTEDVRLALDTPAGPRQLRVGRRPPTGTMSTFAGLPPMLAELSLERRQGAQGCVGIIRFTVWLPIIAPQFDAAVDSLRDCRAMVIDVRGNLGGVVGMVMGMSGHFLSRPDTLGTMRMRGATLQLVANPRRSNRSGQRVEPFSGPVAVLVDELTASTSEFFAAGMQSRGRARVFGSTSSGQALPAGLARLPSGDRLMFVIADFQTPSGMRLEGRGVIPDVLVNRTRAGLLTGRDEPLDAALAWLSTQTGDR